MIKLFSTNRILWAVYLSLLGVLLPHTAWAFHNFEPENEAGKISLVAWTAAFAFEASIAALMLGSGDIKVKGVVAPEGCIDPKKYFTALLKRGAKIHQTETITSMLGL